MTKSPSGSAALRIGVVDIGSNSIRLVIFDSLSRAPAVVFNEKILARLGRGLIPGGKLDPAGVEKALEALRRFSAIAKVLNVSRLIAVATAAVREAADGQDFAQKVEKLCGIKIDILKGEEEARLSALGVVSGIPDAEGVAGDLGGSSLELIHLTKQNTDHHVTLPLGPFRLDELASSNTVVNDVIHSELKSLTWLAPALYNRSFYAVGGAWRAVAKVHMAHVNHPLRVVHQYTVAWQEIEPFLGLLARMSHSSLEKLEGISLRRIDTLAQAAVVLREIGQYAAPAQIVFSAFGLREGCLYDSLMNTERGRDPLIEGCIAYGERSTRFPGHFRLRDAWLNGILTGAPASVRRLASAAVALSDLAWGDHADYRAEETLQRVLALPVVAIDHPGRAFLAVVLYTRYGGDDLSHRLEGLLRLLDEEAQRWAKMTGYALRLAYSFAAGAVAPLTRAKLEICDHDLVMTVVAEDGLLIGEMTRRRIEKLATFLQLRPVIRITE